MWARGSAATRRATGGEVAARIVTAGRVGNKTTRDEKRSVRARQRMPAAAGAIETDSEPFANPPHTPRAKFKGK